MATTPVLITLIAACFALVTGAVYALVNQMNARINDVSVRTGDVIAGLVRLESTIDERFDRSEAKAEARSERTESTLNAKIDRLESKFDARFDRIDDSVVGLRAAVAGIDARLSTLEQRG